MCLITVGCRYDAVQCIIWHAALQWQWQNIDQTSNSQKMPHNLLSHRAVCCDDCFRMYCIAITSKCLPLFLIFLLRCRPSWNFECVFHSDFSGCCRHWWNNHIDDFLGLLISTYLLLSPDSWDKQNWVTSRMFLRSLKAGQGPFYNMDK